MSVKETRQKMGLTQQEFAYRLGVAVSTVARWESGDKTPSRMARTLIRLLLEEFIKKGESKSDDSRQ